MHTSIIAVTSWKLADFFCGWICPGVRDLLSSSNKYGSINVQAERYRHNKRMTPTGVRRRGTLREFRLISYHVCCHFAEGNSLGQLELGQPEHLLYACEIEQSPPPKNTRQYKRRQHALRIQSTGWPQNSPPRVACEWG